MNAGADMAEMSEKFREKGGEIYLSAANQLCEPRALALNVESSNRRARKFF